MSQRLCVFLWLGLGSLLAGREVSASEPVRYVFPLDLSKSSAAAVVDAGLPLAHTAQLLPTDARGSLVGPERLDRQVEAVLDRLESVLRAGGSGLDRLVKVHLYATTREGLQALRTALALRPIGNARPAFSGVVGALSLPEALVAIDAVAVTSRVPAEGIVPGATPAGGNGADLAVLPVGVRVYTSGQAAPGGSLAEASRKTLAGLARTLDHLGLDRSRVVQVKAFLQPMASIAEASREIHTFFGERRTPPLVFVEWRMDPPIEIELIVAGGRSVGGESIEYLTPPGLKPSPVFSRVARLDHGDLIYLAELQGPAGESGASQVSAAFERLGKVLAASGGDFRHLVKATYYVTDDEAGRALNEIRPKYYEPSRPPAASKATVGGAGLKDGHISVDMIATAVSK